MLLEVHWELTEALQRQWRAFWAQCPHSHPRQHFSFGLLERAKGRTPVYLLGRMQGRVVCVAVVSIRPLWARHLSLEAVCLRGPVSNDPDTMAVFLDKIAGFCVEHRIGELRVSPYWFFPSAEGVVQKLGDLGFVPVCVNDGSRSTTGLVNISRDTDSLLASFSKSARREVRRAERQEVQVRPATTMQEAEQFFGALNEMLRERRLTPLSGREWRATFDAVLRTQELGILLNAYKDAKFLGGLLLFRSPHTVHGSKFVICPGGLSGLSNLRISPLLWWQGMLWGREKGCTWLDLEGYRLLKDETHPLYHVYKYKGEFNPEVVDRIHEHRRVCYPVMSGCARLLRPLAVGPRVAQRLARRIRGGG